MYERLLYGNDLTPNIVAIEIAKSDEAVVQLFYRENNKIRTEFKNYKNFAYVTKDNPILDKLWDGTEVIDLLGDLYYNKMVLSKHSKLIDSLKLQPDIFVPRKTSQYYIQSQQTLFKGMNFNDVLTMAIDIEVYTPQEYEFPNSQRETDKIIMIATKTNDNRKRVFVLNEDKQTKKGDNVTLCSNEKELINQFIAYLKLVDPDVLIGHNIFNFDLTYIYDRCLILNLNFNIGRNNKIGRYYTSKIKFAEKEFQFNNFLIYGRHVIDTLILAKSYDVTARVLEEFNLKSIIKQLGRNKEDRVYIEGKDISKYWYEDREKLIHYCFDDVEETFIIYEQFGQSTFYTTQFEPLSYQEVLTLGAGIKVESLFNRYYYDAEYSWPKPDIMTDFKGGYADVLQYGFEGRPQLTLDVRSLYPTLAEILNIHPYKDDLLYFQKLLKLLKKMRLDIKAGAKKAEQEGQTDIYIKLKSMDGSVKILLNAMSFGVLGASSFAFNDGQKAAEITGSGQRVIKCMKHAVQLNGYTGLKLDTDGILLAHPGIETPEAIRDKIQFNLDWFVDNGLLEGKFDEVLNVSN